MSPAALSTTSAAITTSPSRTDAVPTPPFMPRMPRPTNILPTVAPVPAPTLPSATAVGRRRLARAIRLVGPHANAAVAERQVVDHRADDDGHAHVGHAPVVADVPLFEESHHAGRGAERHRAAAGEQDAVNLIERAHRLQHHAERFAWRRAVVVHAGRRGLVEQDGRAAGGAARIGEVPDAQAADVGQRAGGRAATAGRLRRRPRWRTAASVVAPPMPCRK